VSAPLGAVYDRGYQPLDAVPGSPRVARRALFRLTVRRALGVRRSWRQKMLPWFLLGAAVLPAVVNVGIRLSLQDRPPEELDVAFISYRDQVGLSMMLLLFVAVAAPDAVCPDRRNRVLPLLLSRPLTGIDYVLAKVAALTAVLFGFAMAPQVVLFVGQMSVHPDGVLDYVGANAEVLWQVPAAVAVLTVYLAVIGLTFAAFTDRRMVAGIAILGTALVGAAVASLLVVAATASPGSPSGSVVALLNVVGVPGHLRDVIFLGHVQPNGALGGVAGGGWLALGLYLLVMAFCSFLLFGRYRTVEL
jgi:ABC-2 type transport system permease protein